MTTLVIGALGQLGSELVPELRRRYGAESVIASDARTPATPHAGGPFVQLDCTDEAALSALIAERRVGTIYHLAALLSSAAEQKPQLAWTLNMSGLVNVLEAAREHGCRVFVPSSIAAFGSGIAQDHTPQTTIQRPATIYGVTKVAGELLCDYYWGRFGVDVRGLRYPGLISHGIMPGGGTTDYAVEMFHAALDQQDYACYLEPHTRLPMMFMPDGVRAAIELMEADGARLRFRNAYNVQAMSFTPHELAEAITARLPAFRVHYAVQAYRQRIADSWPRSLDDGAAREDWGWQPRYDLGAMTRAMIQLLQQNRKEASHAA